MGLIVLHFKCTSEAVAENRGGRAGRDAGRQPNQKATARHVLSYSPWQRGTNEHSSRLLRGCSPRSLDLATVTASKLDQIAAERTSVRAKHSDG